MSIETIILGILTLIGTSLGAWATYRSTVRGKEIEASTPPPYETLANRLTQLELADHEKGKRIAALERRTRILISALEDQHIWQQAGAVPPPPPIPAVALAIIHKTTEAQEE